MEMGQLFKLLDAAERDGKAIDPSFIGCAGKEDVIYLFATQRPDALDTVVALTPATALALAKGLAASLAEIKAPEASEMN